jgi:hypothetical protein
MKNFIGALLIFLLLAFCNQVAASDWALDVHLASKHFIDPPRELERFNEKNYGLGVGYKISELWSVSGGLYQNSLGSQKFKCNEDSSICSWRPEPKISYYVSVGRSLLKRDSYEIGLEGGIANGYGEWVSSNGMVFDNKTIQGDYLPMAGGYLKLFLPEQKYGVKVRYMFSVASVSFQYGF